MLYCAFLLMIKKIPKTTFHFRFFPFIDNRGSWSVENPVLCGDGTQIDADIDNKPYNCVNLSHFQHDRAGGRKA